MANDGALVKLLSDVQAVAAEAEEVAATTLRFHPAIREVLFQRRVRPLLDRLSMVEREAIVAEWAAATGIGWNILSQTLGVLSGHDASVKIGGRQPNMIYTPRFNRGGWIRVFRSRAAALPLHPSLVRRLVRNEMNECVSDDGEARVRGRWGIPTTKDLSPELVESYIRNSELFDAPWMAAIWKPDHEWVVAGVGTRRLSYGSQPAMEADDPALYDLYSRPYADQTFPTRVDEESGSWAVETGQPWARTSANVGPEVGLWNVVNWIELGLRKGYRVDFIWEPVDKPLDAWEDGLAEVAETPLQGFLVHCPNASFLAAIRYENGEAKLEGVNPEDFPLFRTMTGVDPEKQLSNQDVERLAILGRPIYGRIPSFSMRVERSRGEA